MLTEFLEGFDGFEVEEYGAGMHAVFFGIARGAGLACGRSGAGRRWGGGERRLVIHALRVAGGLNGATG